ncbi:MAG: hypothetical protein ABL930_11505 [Pseudobdellovibrio sp.]
MISLWITIGLVISALCVSSLGAYFSIMGIGALFSGAVVAVWLMAGSLEFAKFTLAAYLHQTWKDLNKVYRAYLVFAVVVLSVITSMGVFGFLSEAYQSASTVLEAETIKLDNIKKQQVAMNNEIARLNRSVEEIPQTRISRKLKARAAVEPTILELNKKIQAGEAVVTAANLKILEVKKKVGPLIYISRSFNMDIDSVVKYLILIFMLVFDPLAICLVIASTHSIESRRNNKYKLKETTVEDFVVPVTEAPVAPPAPAATEKFEEVSDDIVVQMNFKDENEDKKAV